MDKGEYHNTISFLNNSNTTFVITQSNITGSSNEVTLFLTPMVSFVETKILINLTTPIEFFENGPQLFVFQNLNLTSCNIMIV
jgi:hypothetical protein